MGFQGPVDWVMPTKTTVEIRDPLLDAAKEAAAREGTSLRALIEEGLQLALDKRRSRRVFRLDDASFQGKGTQPGVREGDWSRIVASIYEGRGE